MGKQRPCGSFSREESCPARNLKHEVIPRCHYFSQFQAPGLPMVVTTDDKDYGPFTSADYCFDDLDSDNGSVDSIESFAIAHPPTQLEHTSKLEKTLLDNLALVAGSVRVDTLGISLFLAFVCWGVPGVSKSRRFDTSGQRSWSKRSCLRSSDTYRS
ncbi:hypothetical protein BV22DRAFT_352889 [Leucogyrophana mollusca]|uniref:Uncharacterized protein n=1 Tax=Leucogyrophana mollusca TaxID=85980 RepID=A0ACB8BNM5_9AGAM|nr:hypothetical protein BV22DRAFT_352889 [Leucogyrophana mollusca]